MRRAWSVNPSMLNANFCERLIKHALALPESEGQVGSADHQRTDEEYRRSVVRWIQKTDTRFKPLLDFIEETVYTINKSHFGFDLQQFTNIQFTEYDSAYAGHYTWHQDTDWFTPEFFQRKLSFVIQLSDPSTYEGGDFEFHPKECNALPNPEEIRKQGTVVVFPSFIRHRVTPVTEGKRYSLVTWVEGLKFR
jgi:PKHD-type hydroxylase